MRLRSLQRFKMAISAYPIAAPEARETKERGRMHLAIQISNCNLRQGFIRSLVNCYLVPFRNGTHWFITLPSNANRTISIGTIFGQITMIVRSRCNSRCWAEGLHWTAFNIHQFPLETFSIEELKFAKIKATRYSEMDGSACFKWFSWAIKVDISQIVPPSGFQLESQHSTRKPTEVHERLFWLFNLFGEFVGRCPLISLLWQVKTLDSGVLSQDTVLRMDLQIGDSRATFIEQKSGCNSYPIAFQ